MSLVLELSSAGDRDYSATNLYTPAAAVPKFAERAGPNYKGRALTGFALSLGGLVFGLLSPGGLLFALAAILGMIMSGVALDRISTTVNKAGKGWAISGQSSGLLP